MKIEVAKTSGFCFGVNRAINKVQELLDKGKSVCTLGEIIHNKQMVEKLSKSGVRIINTPDEAKKGDIIVIRSHGVPLAVKEEISRLGFECCDATCPFVSKIHNIVSKASEKNIPVIIAGDKNHPEVQGIMGHCKSNVFTFKNQIELEELVKNTKNLYNEEVWLVVQTTFDVSAFKNYLKTIKKVYTNVKIFDTICSATTDRQEEANILSKQSDVMIVIGGKNSSNTTKLYNICKNNCKQTYLIETADELNLDVAVLKKAACIGITAGASTPAIIIKEVFNTMKEILNENEQSFEELLEESLKSMNSDDKVHGVVARITPNAVYVEVEGKKQSGFIPLDELSADPNAKAEDIVKVGDELDLLIMRTNDQEGTIMLSKKRVDANKGWDIISEALQSKEVLTGIVTDVIKGGIIAVTNAIRVFIPASQATVNKGETLESLLKKEVKFHIIEVNRAKRKAVGSIRSVAKEQKKEIMAKFWETAEIGKKYTGKVKSLTSYGAFVDIGGIDGMIHISELSWTKIKHPSEVVNVGDTVEVYIKSFDAEKGKISLGYKKDEDKPWEVLKREYPVGTVAEVQIVSLTSFGAFARILPTIDGLIHISQISDHRIEKPQDVLSVGDKVKAKITAIDFEKKKISLSIRALLVNDEETQKTVTDETTEKTAE